MLLSERLATATFISIKSSISILNNFSTSWAKAIEMFVEKSTDSINKNTPDLFMIFILGLTLSNRLVEAVCIFRVTILFISTFFLSLKFSCELVFI